MKILLGSLDGGQTLRLHYWDKDISDIQEDIHSHRENFTSEVLSGGFEESIYKLKDGKKFRKFIYNADENGKCCEAIFDGLSDIQLVSKEKYCSGDLYSRYKESLHRVSKAEKGTITLSIWEGEGGAAIVLKDLSGCVEGCDSISLVSKFEVIKILSEIRGEFFKDDFS